MKEKLTKVLIAQLLPILAGAAGGWLMVQYPAAYRSLCLAGVL